jgi:sugar phosphate isomerase/epimerase
MKLGIVTAAFAPGSVDEVLEEAVRHGFEAVEFPTGNYGGTPCFDLERLSADRQAIRDLRGAVERHRLTVSALSCQGNPLHPREEIARAHHDVLLKTLRLAAELEVSVVNVFSGCPGSEDGSRYPHWVSCAWPPDLQELLAWQWREKLVPYWRSVAVEARRLGIAKLAVEPMPGFMVYNSRTLLALRAEVGAEIGANLDPSHLFWQGIDPCLAIRDLGSAEALFHFHAKDTFIDPLETARNGLFETRPYHQFGERSWFFRAAGCGHSPETWDRMLLELRRVGYDGVISIEHEDASFSKREGVLRAVAFLRDRIFREPPPEGIWWE